MKRKSISLIIGLMAAALVGVIGMQYYFIWKSYLLQSQLFDESVKAAMGAVVQNAGKREMVRFISDQERKSSRMIQQRVEEQSRRVRIDYLRKNVTEQEITFNKKEKELKERFPTTIELDNSFYETYLRHPSRNYSVKLDIQGSIGGIVQDNQLVVYAENPSPFPKKAKDDSVRYFVVDVSGQDRHLLIALPPRFDRKLASELAHLEEQERIEQANEFFDSANTGTAGLIQNLANEFALSKRPLNQRIDYPYIQDQLDREFKARGIHSPFNVEIHDRNRLLFKLANFQPMPDNAGIYQVSLFPNDPNKLPGSLTVFFPNKSNILLGSIHVMLFSSAGLLLVLIGCFAYTIFIILKQKKISEMKTDFINNMTHEFKTPVATIMIASESLKDPEIGQNKNRVDRLASIIYDENVRLGNHIERVLNIARIDKGDLKLDKKEIDVNELIPVVVDSMELQLQKREASVTLELQATYSRVMADELHLSNVLSNLMDNAIKYSKDKPDIYISTKNVGKLLYITVADKGIGMSKDQLSKIFDQFYRIPTGNRHDVKGFGLGLSYVSDIIKRLNGHIKVKSEKEKGTEFEITLPLCKEIEPIKK
ncbi:two-component system, OmpR family, phosphate regulon sensor histidine kinase PhoR [bacterium A37T11]|nr:two-component system, OmpR family, phosphate regulon sensor histidine kinase PhoR [bacterium A37T11]